MYAMAREQKSTTYNNAGLHMRAMSQSPSPEISPDYFPENQLHAAGNPVRNWIVFNFNLLDYRQRGEGSN